MVIWHKPCVSQCYRIKKLSLRINLRGINNNLINNKGVIHMDFLQNIKGLLISVLFFFAITGCYSILDPDEPGNLVPKTVDDDPSLPNLEINGTKLRSETFGDTANPVIIFLHGGPGDDYESLTRLAGLADDFFLVFFDQRGSGLSRRHDPKDISLQHLITDLDQIIEKYKRSPTDKVNLICHSWGAQYATFYINDNPERATQKIDKMVFSDPGPWKDEWMKYVVLYQRAQFFLVVDVADFPSKDYNA